MSNDKIRVAGYSQRVFFDGGIEYRNFSPDLVGLQLTSDGGSPLFTMGNFAVTTNTTPKITKNFITSNFSNFVSLSSLDLTFDSTTTLLYNNAGVYLNLDKRNLNNFALFGSLTEYFRVSLETIIVKWPAALYINPNYEELPLYQSFSGLTFENYTYDPITNISNFRINTKVINNKFGINYRINGSLQNSFNSENNIRNIISSYNSYVISYNDNDYSLCGFTGSSQTNDYIYLNVIGNPFSGTSGYNIFYIKPDTLIVNEFFNNLDDFESYLLNRQVEPKYTATFKFSVKAEGGNLIYVTDSVTWPVSDGYNIDFDTDEYTNYANSLLEISSNYDLTTSNLMVRFLVTESITSFDTSAIRVTSLDEDETDQKMNKTLNIYGRSYDDLNKYITGIKFANVVSYDKNNNTPDIYLKNLAKVLGWDLISPIVENNLLTAYLKNTKSTFSGQSEGLTPIEADIELWRRIILNTPWIWKSKGTRKAIEFLFKFIGTPTGLIEFNEYIYLAENKIDIDQFRTILQLNGLSDDLSQYSVSEDGYPRSLPNNQNLYYQSDGLWFRETGGINSDIDITTGNNPHVGPYDGGNRYLNQFRRLIPNFSSVTITSETQSTSTTNLFTNYNLGTMTSYSGQTYIDVTTENGVDFSDCYVVTSSFIMDPKQRVVESDCGCRTDEELQSLSICIDKITTEIVDSSNNVETFTLDEVYGFYNFNYKQYNIDGTQYTINGNPILYESKFINKYYCNFGGSIPFYFDEFGKDETGQKYLINSGYICCNQNNRCGCLVTSGWNYTNVYTNSSTGLNYLTFIDEFGNNRVTSKDGCGCIATYTIPTQVLDPFTNEIGIGCQLTEEGLIDLQNPRSIIKETYNGRSNGTLPIDGVYTPINVTEVYGVVLNDTSSVNSPIGNLNYQIFGGNGGSYSFQTNGIKLSGASIGYFALAQNGPIPTTGNRIRMTLQHPILDGNDVFDIIRGNSMKYLISPNKLNKDEFILVRSNLTNVKPILTDINGDYYVEFDYTEIGNENYIYLVWDLRVLVVGGVTNPREILEENNSPIINIDTSQLGLTVGGVTNPREILEQTNSPILTNRPQFNLGISMGNYQITNLDDSSNVEIKLVRRSIDSTTGAIISDTSIYEGVMYDKTISIPNARALLSNIIEFTVKNRIIRYISCNGIQMNPNSSTAIISNVSGRSIIIEFSLLN